MSEPKCNEDLVLDLMNYSPYGALGQAFIVTAIQEYAQMVLKDTGTEYDPDAMFSMQTWRAIAKDVSTRCDAFYNRHKE